jgi:hypothetical protein
MEKFQKRIRIQLTRQNVIFAMLHLEKLVKLPGTLMRFMREKDHLNVPFAVQLLPGKQA